MEIVFIVMLGLISILLGLILDEVREFNKKKGVENEQ